MAPERRSGVLHSSGNAMSSDAAPKGPTGTASPPRSASGRPTSENEVGQESWLALVGVGATPAWKAAETPRLVKQLKEVYAE